jgi:hypothetical protein
MSKEIQTSTGRLWLDDMHGILRFDHIRGSIVTAVQAREDLDAVKSIAGERKRYPLLVDVTKCKSVDRSARETFGGPEAKNTIAALALLSKTPIGNIIANFYISLHVTDNIPRRLFTSEREAVVWLKGFIKE